MRLGLVLGYWGAVQDVGLSLVLEAERLGFDSAWVAEAYGTDAFTPLAWLAARTERIRLGTALAQIPARPPTTTAMTASTLDLLSRGRFLLGLGVSGPQVVEGWYGIPWGKPLGRTREYVSIVRQVLRREALLEHHDEHYDIPYRGPGATGLGRALKLIHRPLRMDIPIYLGVMGPRNVALAAEIADGWIPHLLSPHHLSDLYRPWLEEGLARARPAKSLADIDIAAQVLVLVGDDVAECRRVLKQRLALFVGGYGARTRNFYADAVSRYGYGAAAEQIQALYLGGRKPEAEDAVPDELVDELTLVGPRAHVARQLEAWKRSGVNTLLCWTDQHEALRILAGLA